MNGRLKLNLTLNVKLNASLEKHLLTNHTLTKAKKKDGFALSAGQLLG